MEKLEKFPRPCNHSAARDVMRSPIYNIFDFFPSLYFSRSSIVSKNNCQTFPANANAFFRVKM